MGKYLTPRQYLWMCPVGVAMVPDEKLEPMHLFEIQLKLLLHQHVPAAKLPSLHSSYGP